FRNGLCHQVGLVLLFAGVLKAQETPVAATTATVAGATGTEKVSSGAEVTTAAGGLTGAAKEITNGTSVPPSGGTENITSIALHEDPHAAQVHHDNGGDPYVSPGKHRPGPRHVRAHDGFHNLKNEKHWATWNDAFTTPAL
ncbi:hypothetical protein KR074_000985, partial [Drosophila pseudoananassae]